MALRSSPVVLAVIGLALVAATAAAVYVVTVVSRDHLTTHRGDIAYRLIVTSGTVRDFPTFAKDDRSIDYVYDAASRTAPEQFAIAYASEAHPDDLTTAHSLHCQRQGFDIAAPGGTQGETTVRCMASDYVISAAVQPREDGFAQVRVSFVKRPAQ